MTEREDMHSTAGRADQVFRNRKIDKEKPVPLYYQLREILEEAIGHMSPGNAIPSELVLCRLFDLSRPTVRQAINELVHEGLLYKTKGLGTFVAEPKIPQEFLTVLESFNTEMRRKGMSPRTEILSLERVNADERIRAALDLSEAGSVVRLARLRYADGEPLVTLASYLPEERLPNILTVDFERVQLYDLIEETYGYTIGYAVRSLEAWIAGAYEAHLLSIREGDPIQFIETTTYLVDGTPIEFSRAEYRGDRNRFTFMLSRQRGRGPATELDGGRGSND